MKKTLEDIGKAVGLKPGEATSLFEEVRENRKKLVACTRHQFRPSTEPVLTTLNKRYTCVHCGGYMTGEKISYYQLGVEHAGSPFPVWLDPEPEKA